MDAAIILIIKSRSNPVRAAYITSLESQISSLRDELASVYKTQGQNAQRLLAMNETLREKEELSRIESENLRRAREEIATLRKKVEQHNELMAEKDRTAQVRPAAVLYTTYFAHALHCQILHDEISTLQLELTQIEERNMALTKDNAKLLQRWLDAKQAEVNRMNEANEFYEELKTKRDVVAKHSPPVENGDNGEDKSTTEAPVSGNGEEKKDPWAAMTMDGTPSQAETGLSLTPNG